MGVIFYYQLFNEFHGDLRDKTNTVLFGSKGQPIKKDFLEEIFENETFNRAF